MPVPDILWAALCGAGASAALSFCLDIGRYDIAWGALVGGAGWGMCTALLPASGVAGTESYFWGAAAVAVLAAAVRKPATVYLVPGLLPLVPGGGMFRTMRAAVTGDLAEALQLGLSTLTAAGAIALAVALASSFSGIAGALCSRLRRTSLRGRRGDENG